MILGLEATDPDQPVAGGAKNRNFFGSRGNTRSRGNLGQLVDWRQFQRAPGPSNGLIWAKKVKIQPKWLLKVPAQGSQNGDFEGPQIRSGNVQLGWNCTEGQKGTQRDDLCVYGTIRVVWPTMAASRNRDFRLASIWAQNWSNFKSAKWKVSGPLNAL